jgi:hypothetical protein
MDLAGRSSRPPSRKVQERDFMLRDRDWMHAVGIGAGAAMAYLAGTALESESSWLLGAVWAVTAHAVHILLLLLLRPVETAALRPTRVLVQTAAFALILGAFLAVIGSMGRVFSWPRALLAAIIFVGGSELARSALMARDRKRQPAAP